MTVSKIDLLTVKNLLSDVEFVSETFLPTKLNETSALVNESVNGLASSLPTESLLTGVSDNGLEMFLVKVPSPVVAVSFDRLPKLIVLASVLATESVEFFPKDLNELSDFVYVSVRAFSKLKVLTSTVVLLSVNNLLNNRIAISDGTG